MIVGFEYVKIVEGSIFIVRDKGFDCGFWMFLL